MSKDDTVDISNITKGSSNAKKPLYTKWWFWVIIALVVLVAVGSSGSKPDSGEPKKVGESSQETSGDSGSSSNGTFKVGDVIALRGFEVTVTNIKRNWTAEYDKPKSGKELVKVTVKIENKTDKTAEYSPMDWKMEDSDGSIEDYTITLGNDDQLSSGQLAAGGKKTGSLVFSVPKGDKKLKLHYKPIWEFFNNSEAIVEL